MKVVCAIDSMKGSLSSIECGNAAAEGIKEFTLMLRLLSDHLQMAVKEL